MCSQFANSADESRVFVRLAILVVSKLGVPHTPLVDAGGCQAPTLGDMRILVASSPGVGHLLPLLPVAREAAARGHEVRIATGASLASIVISADFPFERVGPATITEVAMAIPGFRDVRGRRRAVLTFREAFCGPIADTMATDITALATRWQPDVVIREDMAFGAWIAASSLGIPDATIQTTAWRPRLRDLAGPPLDALRVAHGLPSDPGLAGLTGRIFFTTRPTSLRDPAAPYPDGSADLRPIADDRHAGDPVTTGEVADPFGRADGRLRVAVTLGTVNAFETSVLRALIDGAVAAGARVVVALGADPATLGDVPDGVHVRSYVPMSDLLPAADLIAFHGGSGTMLAALGAGRPMVIVPLAADQPDNADRCAAAGVAVVVPPETINAEAVHEAIQTLTADPSYRRRAGEIAAEIAAMPGPDVAVGRIEALVATG